MTDETERTQVNIRVDPETKEKWDQATGREPGKKYQSITELITQAVKKDLSDEADSDDSDAGPVEIDADLSVIEDDLLPAMARIENRFDDLETRLKTVEREITAGPDIDLERTVAEILPPESELDGTAGAMTVTDIAKTIGADRRRVRAAIEELTANGEVTEDRPPSAVEGEDHPAVYYLPED
jgi:hypothetical protein